jgi:hypothetical protein
MSIVIPVLLLSWLILGSALDLQGDAIAEIQGGEEGETSSGQIQRGDKPDKGVMRIEEPDGTLRPLPQTTMPESLMTTEGLQEAPDAGGGTMVNVEGRFRSILQVPEGSDKAIHGNAHEDLQSLKP